MAPFKQMTVPAHLKHPGGRPSQYRPEYCQAVIDFTSQGFSLTAFAGSIRVAKDTVYEWINVHAQFSDAVTRARAARVVHLERKLLSSRKGAETAASIFALRNAEPDEWRDIKRMEDAHPHRVDQLTDAQLHAIAARGMHRPSDDIDKVQRIDTLMGGDVEPATWLPVIACRKNLGVPPGEEKSRAQACLFAQKPLTFAP